MARITYHPAFIQEKQLLQLVEDEDIDKFYLSHLNYAGRGNTNRKHDAAHQLDEVGERQHLGDVLRELARQKECAVVEGHLMPDHVHMMLSIPPKYSVSQVLGFIKGKSAIHIARVDAGRRRNFVGQHFWARGYWVSTVGKNEAAVREYIQNQEKEDQRLEQLKLRAL